MSFRPSALARTGRFVGSLFYIGGGAFFFEVARRIFDRRLELMAGLLGGFSLAVFWVGLLWMVTVFYPSMRRERFARLAHLAVAPLLLLSFLGQTIDAIRYPGPLWKPLFVVASLVVFPFVFHFSRRWFR